MIKKVDAHSSQLIYTRSVEKPEKPAGGAKAEGAPAKGKGGDQKGKQQPKKQPQPKKGAAAPEATA